MSQEHLDARRRQILNAARRCFVRNGFHATSMQDVFGEAELSAGAVYRYFRSKDDIIAAIATDVLAKVTSTFEAVFEADNLPPIEEVLGRIFATIQHLDSTQDLAKVVIQVWSETLRSPSLAERFTAAICSVQRILARLVETYQDRGLIARSVPADQVAAVLVGLVHGFMVQHALTSDVNAAMFDDGLRALLVSNGPATKQYDQKPYAGT